MTLIFYENMRDHYGRYDEDPDVPDEEMVRCLEACTESSDSQAAPLGFGRQVFAAPLVPHPGYAPPHKRGAFAQVLVVVEDETDLGQDGAKFDVAMHYLREDGGTYAPPDTARFAEHQASGCDPSVASVLHAAVVDVWQRGWFDPVHASMVAAQIERAERSGGQTPRIPLPVIIEE